jgi:hypothetical protein
MLPRPSLAPSLHRTRPALDAPLAAPALAYRQPLLAGTHFGLVSGNPARRGRRSPVRRHHLFRKAHVPKSSFQPPVLLINNP